MLAACQQVDQALPFDLAAGTGATVTLGPNGGTLSVPPSFSINFPAGSLPTSTTVDVAPRISVPFPGDAGASVPGSAFDVGPVGTMLSTPARVELAVDPDFLDAGDEVRLSIAVVRQNGSVATFDADYDLTNGIISADIDELGPIAAVVTLDAIAFGADAPPSLGGGSFPQPTPPPVPGGPQLSSHGGVEFAASCAPSGRQCFSSGLIRVWADAVVRERLGEQLYLLSPTVEGHLDFFDFDLAGVPTRVVGSLTVEGDVRARFNSSVTRSDLDDGVSTGPGAEPAPTDVSVAGNVLIVGETTAADGTLAFDESLEFGKTGVGTTQMMTLRVETELEFDNSDGSVDIGVVVAHVRLRVPQS